MSYPPTMRSTGAELARPAVETAVKLMMLATAIDKRRHRDLGDDVNAPADPRRLLSGISRSGFRFHVPSGDSIRTTLKNT